MCIEELNGRVVKGRSVPVEKVITLPESYKMVFRASDYPTHLKHTLGYRPPWILFLSAESLISVDDRTIGLETFEVLRHSCPNFYLPIALFVSSARKCLATRTYHISPGTCLLVCPRHVPKQNQMPNLTQL